MRRIALVGWVLLGVGAATPFAMGQTPTGTPSDQTGAAANPPSPVSVAPSTAPAPLMPKGPVRISGGVMAKNQISKVSPEYPAMATLKRLNGDVVLRILISKTGTIEKAEVMRSTDPVFNQASIDAVRQWRYRPFLLNGEPVEVDSTVVVSFRL